MIIGNQEILNQLRSKGFNAWMHTNNFVCFKYKIPLGRFKGQEIEIALQAPQFPNLPPSGPYIKPHLLPIKVDGDKHPFDRIHDWKKPTADFQYWSRPFRGWTSGMNIDDYVAFLRTLFDF